MVVSKKQIDFSNFILTLLTAITIGSFTFSWKTNSDMAVLKDHDVQNLQQREEFGAKMNNMQLDLQEVKERLARIEAKTSKNQ